MNDYKDLIERDEWLADKIPAFGDFGKDCALYLRKSADAIEALIDERDNLRAALEAKEQPTDEKMREDAARLEGGVK